MAMGSESLLQQGIVANKDREYDKAIKLLTSTLQQDSKLVEAYIERGKAKFYLEQYTPAIEDFDRALQEKPNFVDAYISRGKAKSYLKQDKEAMKDFDRAIELNPKSLSAYVWRGKLYRDDLKQKERGDEDFDRALKIIPESDDDYWALGIIFEDRKDYAAGIRYFTNAIDLNYKNKHYAYVQIAWLYRDINPPNFNLAIINERNFLQSKNELTTGQQSRSHQRIALSYLDLKKYSEAIQSANESLRLNPKNDLSLAHRGQAFYSLKNYSAALRDFDNAIAISPKSAFFHTWRGYIYRDLNNYERAIIEFDRAIELSPSTAYHYQNRGDINFYRLNRSAAGLADYQKALKLTKLDGDVEMVKDLNDSIDDLQTQPQRMIIGCTIAFLLTMVGFGGLMAICRHNEAKYLRQFRV
jgi:tetratricopeptide (TPR) repeat protein